MTDHFEKPAVDIAAKLRSTARHLPAVRPELIGAAEEIERLRQVAQAWELACKRVAFLHAPDAQSAVAEAWAIYESWAQ